MHSLSAFQTFILRICLLLHLLCGLSAESASLSVNEAKLAVTAIAKTVLFSCKLIRTRTSLVQLEPKEVDQRKPEEPREVDSALSDCILSGLLDRERLQKLEPPSPKQKNTAEWQKVLLFYHQLWKLVQGEKDEFERKFSADREFFAHRKIPAMEGEEAEENFLNEKVLGDLVLCIKLFHNAYALYYEALLPVIAGKADPKAEEKFGDLDHQLNLLEFLRLHAAKLTADFEATMEGTVANRLAERMWLKLANRFETNETFLNNQLDAQKKIRMKEDTKVVSEAAKPILKKQNADQIAAKGMAREQLGALKDGKSEKSIAVFERRKAELLRNPQRRERHHKYEAEYAQMLGQRHLGSDNVGEEDEPSGAQKV